MSLPDTIDPSAPHALEPVEIAVADYFNGAFKEAIQNLTPELRLLSEQALTERLDPTPLDYAMRNKFWEVVDLTRKMGKSHIFQTQIYEGCCDRSYFDKRITPNPLRIAWLIRPPVSHVAFYEAINKVALQKVLAYVKDNPISEKNMAHLLKVLEMSANRAYGAVAQKMQIQSKNLNVEVKSHGGDSPPPPDQEQLSQKIEAMQAQLMAGTKDVTPKE